MHAPTPALLSNLSCVASALCSPFHSETFVWFLNRTAYAPLLPSRHYEPRFTNAIVDGVKNVENRFGRVLNVQMFILCVAPRRLMLRVLCRYFSAVGDGGAAGLVKDIILDTGGNLNWLTVRLLCARLLRAITLCLVSFLHALHVPHPVTLNPFPSRIIPQPVSKVDSNTQTAAASGSDFIGTPRALRLSCGSAGSTFVISEGNACVLPSAPHVFKPVALPACAGA
jgi:hypothetical protein